MFALKQFAICAITIFSLNLFADDGQLWHSQIGDRSMYFREHQVVADGDCGFHCIAMSRMDVLNQLLRNSQDAQVRALIAPMLSSVDEQNLIADDASTFHRFIINYLSNRGNWVTNQIFDAIAYLNHMNIHILRPDNLDNLQLVHTAHSHAVNAANVYLILTNNDTHFNLLHEISYEQFASQRQTNLSNLATAAISASSAMHLGALFISLGHHLTIKDTQKPNWVSSILPLAYTMAQRLAAPASLPKINNNDDGSQHFSGSSAAKTPPAKRKLSTFISPNQNYNTPHKAKKLCRAPGSNNNALLYMLPGHKDYGNGIYIIHSNPRPLNINIIDLDNKVVTAEQLWLMLRPNFRAVEDAQTLILEGENVIKGRAFYVGKTKGLFSGRMNSHASKARKMNSQQRLYKFMKDRARQNKKTWMQPIITNVHSTQLEDLETTLIEHFATNSRGGLNSKGGEGRDLLVNYPVVNARVCNSPIDCDLLPEEDNIPGPPPLMRTSVAANRLDFSDDDLANNADENVDVVSCVLDAIEDEDSDSSQQ